MILREVTSSSGIHVRLTAYTKDTITTLKENRRVLWKKELIRKEEINFNYDKEADVMYVSFEKRKKADRTDDSHYPTIYRYANNELLGITIFNYSSMGTA